MHTSLTVKHLQISLLKVFQNQYSLSHSRRLLWMSSKCFVCISSFYLEVVFCLRVQKLIWREGWLLIHSFNIGNFFEEINGIPYFYDMKKEFLSCLVLETCFHWITCNSVGKNSQLPLFKNAQWYAHELKREIKHSLVFTALFYRVELLLRRPFPKRK